MTRRFNQVTFTTGVLLGYAFAVLLYGPQSIVGSAIVMIIGNAVLWVIMDAPPRPSQDFNLRAAARSLRNRRGRVSVDNTTTPIPPSKGSRHRVRYRKL